MLVPSKGARAVRCEAKLISVSGDCRGTRCLAMTFLLFERAGGWIAAGEAVNERVQRAGRGAGDSCAPPRAPGSSGLVRQPLHLRGSELLLALLIDDDHRRLPRAKGD